MHLQDNVLCCRVVVTALLIIASKPGMGTGLIEGFHCPKREVQLVLVEGDHLSQVVHKGIVVLRRKVVFCTI